MLAQSATRTTHTYLWLNVHNNNLKMYIIKLIPDSVGQPPTTVRVMSGVTVTN